MRVVFMGTSEFAVSCLERLVLAQYQVVAVYTRADSPAGRGRRLMSPPVKRAAQDWGLSVVQPDSLDRAEVVEQLAGFRPDVIVVAAYGQILPQAVLDIPGYGCINVHPSLLPRFRGASPVAAAILAGDELTGVSLILMDRGLDTGPVLSRLSVPVSPWDTAGLLTARLSQVGARLLAAALPRWCSGELTAQPQNDAETTCCREIAKRDGEIDWRLSARELWQRVRAFQPWPGGFTMWQGRRLEIVEAMPLHLGLECQAGRVIELTPALKGTAFGVGTGDGILGVLKVKPEGRRAMSAAEFLRGQRQVLGALLSSA